MKKVLACIFLLIDHIGLYYADRLPVPVYLFLRVLGSLSLPLFAYSFARGFLRTHNSGLYFLRIFSCAMLAQVVLVTFLPVSGLRICDFPLNSLYTLLCSFGVLYGCELIFSIPSDRVGSLHLIEANAESQSDRYGVRIGNGLSGTAPRTGAYIPSAPPAALFCLALLLIVPSVLVSVFVNMEYGIFGVLTVLLFYLVEKKVPKNRGTWMFFLFLVLDLAYVLIYYGVSKTFSVHGASIAAIFLCYLPVSDKKPPLAVKHAFYIFYPVHILVLLLLRLVI